MAPTFAAIVAAARLDADLTAAEFDYRLNLGTEVGALAYQGLGNAIYRLANEGQPEVNSNTPMSVFRERTARANELTERFGADIDRMVADAKARCYTGWSAAGRGPIRYADGGSAR